MEKEEFIKEIQKQSDILEKPLTEIEEQLFFKYMNLLIEWNRKMNLTAIIEPKEIIQKHFIDSLTVLPYIKENSKIIDVGTGAGFPGIPLKIKDKNFSVTLLDSLNKRITFLNEVITQLGLNQIETIHSRVEDAGKDINHREKYDVSVSRAVAPLNILLEYLLPLVKVGGICICMKGSSIEDELEKSKNAINILGGKIEKVEEFQLPHSDITRNIIIIKKIKNTPNKYPRKPGTPSKEPIE